MNSKIPTLYLSLIVLALSGCVSVPNPSASKVVNIDTTFGRYEENLEPDLILITVTPQEHARLTTQFFPVAEGSLPKKYHRFLDELNTKYGLTRVADWPLAAIDVYCIVFENQSSQSREELVAALQLEPGIESAQTVQTFEVQAQEYNDPYYTLQHGLHSLQASTTHRWSRGKGVRVAVVDTGADHTHPDLERNTEITHNFVDRDEGAFISDLHGTAVGGIIAAVADNDTGMVGVAPEAKLLSLKACWHTHPSTQEAVCNSMTLAKALNFSIKKQVDIINLSLTGPPDPLLERLVQTALAENIIVVGAKPSHGNPAFPILVPGTIAVAMPSDESENLSAPGRRVLSTRPNSGYDFYDGSSFSTAHIAGLAAVIRQLSPTLTPAELLTLLVDTSDPVTGAVNACRAVVMLAGEGDTTVAYDRCG